MTQVPPPMPQQDVPPQEAPLAYAAIAQESQDISHLNLLSVFYFVVGPLALLFGSFPIIHLVIGFMMYTGQIQTGPNSDPNAKWVGLMFMAIGLVFVLFGWAIGLTTIYAGLQLRRRRRWLFCMVVAAILCAFFPFGTVLGVFSIIILMRSSVRPLFS